MKKRRLSIRKFHEPLSNSFNMSYFVRNHDMYTVKPAQAVTSIKMSVIAYFT